MKVLPKNDDIRKRIAHPTAGPFRESGPAEWPEDGWTARRIRDGDVTVEEPKEDRPKMKPAAAPDKLKE